MGSSSIEQPHDLTRWSAILPHHHLYFRQQHETCSCHGIMDSWVRLIRWSNFYLGHMTLYMICCRHLERHDEGSQENDVDDTQDSRYRGGANVSMIVNWHMVFKILVSPARDVCTFC
jgi:hypothetical protein